MGNKNAFLNGVATRWQKGHPPPTAFKPGVSGNPSGRRHAQKCADLIEKHRLTEEMALIASKSGKYKKVGVREQIDAFKELRDGAFGKPATNVVQVLNVGQMEFVKRVIGVDDNLV